MFPCTIKVQIPDGEQLGKREKGGNNSKSAFPTRDRRGENEKVGRMEDNARVCCIILIAFSLSSFLFGVNSEVCCFLHHSFSYTFRHLKSEDYSLLYFYLDSTNRQTVNQNILIFLVIFYGEPREGGGQERIWNEATLQPKRAGERERNSKDKWLRPLFIGMEGERGERRRGEKRRREGDLVWNRLGRNKNGSNLIVLGFVYPEKGWKGTFLTRCLCRPLRKKKLWQHNVPIPLLQVREEVSGISVKLCMTMAVIATAPPLFDKLTQNTPFPLLHVTGGQHCCRRVGFVYGLSFEGGRINTK